MKYVTKLNLTLAMLALAWSVWVAEAASPSITVVDVNDSWVDNSCDVPFYNHLEGTIRFITLTDRDGNVVRSLDTLSMTFTTTNPLTGEEYPFRSAGSDNTYFEANGDMVYTGHGTFDRLIVQGQGAAWQRVGLLRIVFPADGSDPITTFRGDWDSDEDLCTLWHSLSF
jgi:hypothetical protein